VELACARVHARGTRLFQNESIGVHAPQQTGRRMFFRDRRKDGKRVRFQHPSIVLDAH
jgi:hypothetical protein